LLQPLSLIYNHYEHFRVLYSILKMDKSAFQMQICPFWTFDRGRVEIVLFILWE